MLRRLAAGVVLLIALAQSAESASRVDPRLRFRVMRTAHFTIYFHQDGEALAGRLAPVAEEVWTTVPNRLGLSAPPHTHVVLADQSDLANGWAFPLPFNTVLLHAAVPSGAERIGRVTDWLRIVFTHEFTHIVHLDRSEGWARGVRRVFGRIPFAFPNLFLPEWMIEGLATYEESTTPGEGRLAAGDFRAIERTAAAAGRVAPLDRVNGGLVAWPSQETPYAFGLGFHEFLVTRRGEPGFGELAHRTAGRVPFFGSGAFRSVYGKDLNSLWSEYAAHATATADTRSGRARRLTTSGFSATGPRFLVPACGDCPMEIAYSLQTPHDFPTLHAVGLDGGRSRPLATRVGGRTLGVSQDVIVFNQQDTKRNIGLYSDLYVLTRETGRVQALSSEARYLDPDLAPDGRTVVCVREGGGRRALIVLSMETGSSPRALAPRVLLDEPDVVFSSPRWSPDGRHVAAERRRPNGWPEIVIVDADSGMVRSVLRMDGARVVTPAWRPDGKAVVAAADASGQVFDLWEFPLEGGRSARRLTAEPGGALWPDVSADGTRIAFVSTHSTGSDVYLVSYAPLSETRAFESDPQVAEALAPAAAVPSSAYRPWSTLRPTSWSPSLEDDGRRTRVGAMASGADVLGYHRWSASLGWIASGPHDVSVTRARPDWRMAYAYDRWRATYTGSISSARRFVPGRTSTVALRRDEMEAGVVLPFRGVRTTQVGAAFVSLGRDRRESATAFDSSTQRGAFKAGWSFSSAHQYGYSVSLEEGTQAALVVETVTNEAADVHRSRATRLSADVRRYVRGWSRHHVAAIRLAGGYARDGGNPNEWFTLGGDGPAGEVDGLFSQPFGLLRGFPVDRFAGSRLVIANLDYRWPLAWPERGVGIWPGFLRSLQGALFADIGHTWTPPARAADFKVAAGVELGTSLVLGYSLPLSVTVGVGVGRDGARPEDPLQRRLFARVGAAF